MPAIETAIWLALRGRVETLVLNPIHPVAWPNEAFTAPQTDNLPAPYLKVTHLPNRTERVFLNGADPHWYRGILQISAMYPLAQLNGEVGAREIAGQVAAHFPAGLPLYNGAVRVDITARPTVAQGFRDDASARWLTPVSVPYECFA